MSDQIIDMKTEVDSTQLNSDDLLTAPKTITITHLKQGQKDQPVEIYYGDPDGKCYRPCKSMRRVIIALWGSDTRQYVGRSMTLFREPSVKWGGQQVGGIQISHMTNIDKPRVIPITISRGKKKPLTVKPLETPQNAQKQPSDAQQTARRASNWDQWFEIAGITQAQLIAYREAHGLPKVSELSAEKQEALFSFPVQAGEKVREWEASQ